MEHGLDDGGGQDDQRRGAEPQAMCRRYEGGARQRDGAAGPPPPGGTLTQEARGQQAGVDRGGRHQQARGPGGHDPLAGVEQQLVSGHAGQAA
jgi:hypothetical protein